jgi:hypothetical protein
MLRGALRRAWAPLDPRGAGYQKIQSQIAVGSGGLLGRGMLLGLVELGLLVLLRPWEWRSNIFVSFLI